MSNELLRTRIGNTVTVVLPVLTRGDAVSLVGRDITIMLVDPNDTKTPVSFTIGGVSNNIATFVVEGTSQSATGTYRAEVYENYRGTAMAVYDCDIFVLVARTEYENDGNEGVSSETTTLDPINIAWVGRDGYTPYIQDGYWYINGTSTNVKAAGENGDTPYIENGYWYIGGVSTGIKVDYTNEEAQRAASEQVRVVAEAARVQAEAARTLAENSRLTEESGRSAAEGVRILAERDRQAAETTRQTQEEIRHDNEEARVEAELGRAASEASRAQVEATRVANESTRTTAEATRAANEQTRVADETDRAAAETARIAAETARETAEDGRASAEATRVSNEQTRVSNESTRQSNESARQSAETARQAAYVAAENARDAAFAEKEATRDAANEAALNCAETLAALGPKIDKELGYDKTETYTNADLAGLMLNMSNHKVVAGTSNYDTIIIELHDGETIKATYSGARYAPHFFTDSYPSIGDIIDDSDTYTLGSEVVISGTKYLWMCIGLATTPNPVVTLTRKLDGVKTKVAENEAAIETLEQSFEQKEQEQDESISDIRSIVGQREEKTLTSSDYSGILMNVSDRKYVAASTSYDSFIVPIHKGETIEYVYTGGSISASSFFITTQKPVIGGTNTEYTQIPQTGNITADAESYLFFGIAKNGGQASLSIVSYYGDSLTEKVKDVEEQLNEQIPSLLDNFTEGIESELEKTNANVDGFVNTNGSINTSFNDWKHDKIVVDEIDPDAEYHLYTSFNGGAGTIPSCVFFSSSDSVLGNCAQSSGDRVITIPEGTAYILVNKHPVAIDTYVKKIVYQQKAVNVPTLEKRVEALEAKSVTFEKGYIKFSKMSNKFFVRTALNDNQDIVIEYQNGDNGFKDPTQSFIGANTLSTTEIAGGTRFHYAGDSVAPIQTSYYWFIAGRHGYYIPTITSSSHDKTDDDLGSWWKDTSDVEYKLVKIASNVLTFEPKITISQSGAGVRGWNYGQTIGGPLVHISGATHTDSIVVDSQGGTQVRPACFNIVERFFADGIEVTENVTDLVCKELVYKVSYDVKNPASATQIFPSFDCDDAWFTIKQTYRFVGLSCSVNQSFKVNSAPIPCVYYGATQPLGLTSYSTWHSYTFIPKVKSGTNQTTGITTDWKYPQDTTTPNQSWGVTGFPKNSTYCEDLTNLPERYVQYYANNNEKLVGFASGLSMISSNTKSDVRSANIGDTNKVLQFSQDGRNKMYFRVIEQAGRVLPIGFTANYNYYQCYFDPNASDALVYWYKDGSSWVVYVHNFAANDSAKIVLPSFMEGMTATLIEKSSNAELLTDTVVDGEMFAKFADSNAAYIVYKLA